ncbi:MAG: ECF-type sigma factor [Vicinamibacterales bacterium]
MAKARTPPPTGQSVTALLREWSRGDADAGEQVATLIYGELHRRAAAHIRRERQPHTLSPTDLLHDVFLQLARQHVEWANRGQFYGTACQMMRRALVDHARARSAGKRGGLRVELKDDRVAVAPADLDVMALDEALTELGRVDERQARLVELRFFGGLTLQEAADTLGMSLATANRDWRFARAWLFNRLSAS